MVTVGVVGSRSYRDYARMKQVLDALREEIGPFFMISGGADGADLLAERYAREENDGMLLVYHASWYDKEGNFDKTGGFQRNTLIVEDSEIIVAFWDEKSSGTADTIAKARRLGRDVRIETFLRPGDKLVQEQKTSARAQEAEIMAAFDLGEGNEESTEPVRPLPADTHHGRSIMR